MPLIKPFDSCGAGSLEVGQTRPAAQKVQRERAVELFAHQFQGLGIIAFEDTALSSLVNWVRWSTVRAPRLGREASQLAGGHLFRGQRPEPMAMVTEQIQQHPGIGHVVPWRRRVKALRIRALVWMDRKSVSPEAPPQQIHQGAFARFQRQGDRPALEALVELLDPSADQFRGMGEGGGFGGLGTSPRHGVLAVAPIESMRAADSGATELNFSFMRDRLKQSWQVMRRGRKSYRARQDERRYLSMRIFPIEPQPNAESFGTEALERIEGTYSSPGQGQI